MDGHENLQDRTEVSPEIEVGRALAMLNGPVLDALARRIPEPMYRDLVALSYAATLRAAQSVGIDPMDFLVRSPINGNGANGQASET